MTSVSTIIWLVSNKKGTRLGTVVNNSLEQATKDACNIYKAKSEDIDLIDSGERKMKCCDKCKDTPCGTPEGQV
jgi:hypothetical protein